VGGTTPRSCVLALRRPTARGGCTLQCAHRCCSSVPRRQLLLERTAYSRDRLGVDLSLVSAQDHLAWGALRELKRGDPGHLIAVHMTHSNLFHSHDHHQKQVHLDELLVWPSSLPRDLVMVSGQHTDGRECGLVRLLRSGHHLLPRGTQPHTTFMDRMRSVWMSTYHPCALGSQGRRKYAVHVGRTEGSAPSRLQIPSAPTHPPTHPRRCGTQWSGRCVCATPQRAGACRSPHLHPGAVQSPTQTHHPPR
jgi:hypothetical protein